MGATKKFISQEYSAEKGGKNLKEGTKRSRGANIFATTFFSFAIIVGVALITFTVLFSFATVQGTSMMNTLNASVFTEAGRSIDSDSVVVSRYATPRRGDIIVVNHYNRDGSFDRRHIKRLIAFSTATHTDSIYFRAVGSPVTHYLIEINGQLLDETDYAFSASMGTHSIYNNLRIYLLTGNHPDSGGRFDTHYTDANGVRQPFRQWVEANQFHSGRHEIVLPPGFMFYMGDNRGGNGTTDVALNSISADSAKYGPKPMTNIVGVVQDWGIIRNQTTLQWVWNRFVWLITFGTVNR